ncbi:MAG TPA: hypothetical protein VKA60_23485 [Blastocatellia bacterium]|nr:hypothetical protein [Blastocatellia bacterium]
MRTKKTKDTRPDAKDRTITAREVVAECFTLVDPTGKVRGEFFTSADRTIFTLRSPVEDGPTISLITDKEGQFGYAEMIVKDPSSAKRITGKSIAPELSDPLEYTPVRIGMHPYHDDACGHNPNPSIELAGCAQKRTRLRLSMTVMDYPVVDLTGPDGETMLELLAMYRFPQIRLHTPDSKYRTVIDQAKITRLAGDHFQDAQYGKPVKLGSKEHRGMVDDRLKGLEPKRRRKGGQKR